MKIMIFIGIVMLLVGCSPYEFIGGPQLPGENDWEEIKADYLERENWKKEHSYLAKTENHPKEFNCSTLAWIIENNVYPKEIYLYYNSTKYKTNETYQYRVDTIFNTKEQYDDYYFKRCLTQFTNWVKEDR